MQPFRARTQLLRRIALGVGLAAALWPAIFALDVFAPDVPPLEQALALLIHLLPNAILLLMVLVAWRSALLGGLLLILTALLAFLLLRNPFWVNALLGGPVLLAGVLFLLSAWQERS